MFLDHFVWLSVFVRIRVIRIEPMSSPRTGSGTSNWSGRSRGRPEIGVRRKVYILFCGVI